MYRYNSQDHGFGLRRLRTSNPFGIAATLFDYVANWQDRRRQRHALARLDDRMLRDIGLTSVDVDAEVSKPFWR
jgi:uncharacterized protein YjiS (DUF1127 family)